MPLLLQPKMVVSSRITNPILDVSPILAIPELHFLKSILSRGFIIKTWAISMLYPSHRFQPCRSQKVLECLPPDRQSKDTLNIMSGYMFKYAYCTVHKYK